MNKMKKITATAAAMVLSAGIAVGGTLAYLNSVTETKTNTFTSSKNITTTLTETEWLENSGKDYTPGQTRLYIWLLRWIMQMLTVIL